MAIQVKGLDFTYQPGTTSERHALRNVSLRVADGEFLAIVGASGSGKSTLAQHLNGAILPPPGKVFVNGLEAKKGISPVDLVSNVGLVFQYPEHQLFAETVREEIAYGCRNLGFAEGTMVAASRRALDAVGLDTSYLSRSPFRLSGGEKRRVALASVLAMDPPILILDEPTVGLDRSGKAMIGSVLRSLHREGKTIIVIGHDLAELRALAPRLVVMHRGAVVADGELSKGDLAQYGISLPQPFQPREMLQKHFPENYGSAAAKKILAFLEGGDQ